MRPVARAHLQMHFCVFLWGFTAIIGKLITLSALPLVWWRMVIVVLALVAVPAVRRGLRRLPRGLAGSYAAVGSLVALHWLTFYGAIKLASASVAASAIALAPVFLAWIEPLVTGRRFRPWELFFGAAVVPGVVLVLGGMPSRMHWGAAVGALSALLVAVFGAFNKRLIEKADPLTVTCIELGSGTVALTAVAFVGRHMPGIAPRGLGLTPALAGPLFPVPTARDAALLVVLSMGCTLLPFALSLVALRHLSAYAAQLVTNLEPVYAIFLAAVLLGEQHELHGSFYAGVVIVLAVVLAYPLLGSVRSAGGPLQ